MKLLYMTFAILLALTFIACDSGFNNKDSTSIERKNGKTVLIDQTGKRWDITHAVQKYQMNPDNFEFGLGPQAIQPILNPKFLNPGDPGYPESNEDFLVIGTTLSNDTRAYPISVLTQHEIIDEEFGNTQVAVAY